MKVLVIGGGGREHAICWKLKQSPLVDKIYCTPGNGGIEEIAECIPINATDIEKIIKFANQVDIIVVGPENPLAEGIINELPKNKGFGPTKEAAYIEADKAFAKELMKKVGIPTAEFSIFNNVEKAITFVENIKYPIVIKVAGLAFGKGAFIIKNKKEAIETLNKIMVEKIFGSAGDKVVIEEYLEGEEVSVIAFTDGKDFIPLLPCQDYKKLLDGDKGPNTGGMGSYAPAVLNKDEVGNIIEKIFAPCIWGLKKEGVIYKGILYGGLIITEKGPKVLEFNCRFGDPETQPVMPLLKTDLMELILATIEEKLKFVSIKWDDAYSVCVVIASKGYPEKYETGKEITGLNLVKDVIIFHAGTKRYNDKFYTSGGRVIGVTCVDKNLKNAASKVYNEINKIHFDGMYYRKDIAANKK